MKVTERTQPPPRPPERERPQPPPPKQPERVQTLESPKPRDVGRNVDTLA